MSTAYSGSTAMKARTAIARPAEMSSWATSAAHDRRNAAPTIDRPNSSAARDSATWAPETRRTSPGSVTATAAIREAPWRDGWMSRSSSLSVVTMPPQPVRPKVSSPRREGPAGPIGRDDGEVRFRTTPLRWRQRSRGRIPPEWDNAAAHGMARARPVAGGDPRRGRAVHERRGVDRGGLRPVRRRRRERARRRRDRPSRDHPADHRDRVRPRGRQGDRNRRDPRGAVHAHHPGDVRDRGGRVRHLQDQRPQTRARGRPRGAAAGPRLLPRDVRARDGRRARPSAPAQLGPLARPDRRLRVLRAPALRSTRGAGAGGRGRDRDPAAVRVGVVPPRADRATAVVEALPELAELRAGGPLARPDRRRGAPVRGRREPARRAVPPLAPGVRAAPCPVRDRAAGEVQQRDLGPASKGHARARQHDGGDGVPVLVSGDGRAPAHAVAPRARGARRGGDRARRRGRALRDDPVPAAVHRAGAPAAGRVLRGVRGLRADALTRRPRCATSLLQTSSGGDVHPPRRLAFGLGGRFFLAIRPSPAMSWKIVCASEVRFTTELPPTMPVVPGATTFSTYFGFTESAVNASLRT